MAANGALDKKESGRYTEMDFNETVDDSLAYLCQKNYRRDEPNHPINQKIIKAYRTHFNREFRPVRNADSLKPRLINGASALGKSAAVQATYKLFADLMGMKLHVNPIGQTQFTENDMVVTIINFKEASGYGSTRGMPVVSSINDDGGNVHEFTSNVVPYSIHVLSKAAGAGITLLNAEEINSAESEEKSQFTALLNNDTPGADLENMSVLATGNLGGMLDGNDATPGENAFVTRFKMTMFVPKHEHWKAHIEKKYPYGDGYLGDYGVTVFLDRYTDYRNETPPRVDEMNGPSSIYASYRTWDAAITELESQYPYQEDAELAGINEIQNHLAGSIGTAAAPFSIFFHQYHRGVVPLCQRVMENKFVDEKEKQDVLKTVEDRMKGINADMEQTKGVMARDFVVSWSHHAPIEASARIVDALKGYGIDADAKKFKDEVEHQKAIDIFEQEALSYARAISLLPEAVDITNSVSKMSDAYVRSIASQIPFLTQGESIRSELRGKFAVESIRELKRLRPDLSSTSINSMINLLSNHDEKVTNSMTTG